MSLQGTMRKKNPKKFILYDSIYIKFQKLQNFRNGGQVTEDQMAKSGKERDEGGVAIKGNRRDTCGVKILSILKNGNRYMTLHR